MAKREGTPKIPAAVREDYWGQGVDLKRFFLCVQGRLWTVLAAAMSGALLAAALYAIVRQVTMGPPKYRAEVLFFIGYDIREEDEVLKEFINEYNAYTWGDMMKSDRVILPVMEAVPEADRQEIEDSLSTEIASDPEYLTAYFTTEDEELSNRIAVAYIGAMAAFGETMQGRGLTGIEAWKTVPAARVVPENRAANAAALGAILGLVAGALLLAGWYILDDSVLLESDLSHRYGLRVFGYRTRKPEARWEAALNENLTYRARKEAFREVLLEEVTGEGIDYDTLREAPLLLLIQQGTPCLRRLSPILSTLALQDVTVKVIGIDENNRINLSMKQVLPPPARPERRPNARPAGYRNENGGERRPGRRPGVSSFQAAPPQPKGPVSFEDQLKQFMASSDSKLSELHMNEKRSSRRGRR